MIVKKEDDQRDKKSKPCTKVYDHTSNSLDQSEGSNNALTLTASRQLISQSRKLLGQSSVVNIQN